MEHFGADFCETDSGRVYGAPQLLELEQHRQHAFELSVKMNLVTGEAFEPIRVNGFATCLLSDHRPIVDCTQTLSGERSG